MWQLQKNLLIGAVFIIFLLIIAWVVYRAKVWSDFGKQETVIVHDIVLEQIENIGKLELVKYKLKDVLEYKQSRSFLPDAKAVLIISGEAVGCIDLTRIKTADIVEKDSTLYIRLPEPELCYVKVNHQESRVYNTSNTYFDEAKIIQSAYQAAEAQIQKAALQSNILEQTKQNAQLVLKPLLEASSRRKVVFTYELPAEEIRRP